MNFDEQVSGGIPLQEHEHHQHGDPHRRGADLAPIILGGQDGLVNTLGVILGVAAASSNAKLVIAAGLAACFAESISMGAVAYTSTLAEHAYYESERAREQRHVVRVPTLEREEIRTIYRQKGFEGDLLERIVETITANRDTWVAVMMAEEHRLQPVDRATVIRRSAVVFAAAMVGSLVPLAPFLALPIAAAVMASIALSTLVLFAVGVWKGHVMRMARTRSGLEIALIGIVSALAGFFIGWIFRV